MRLGSNYYKFKSSFILVERARITLIVSVAVTLGIIGGQFHNILLYILAVALNLLHLFIFNNYLKKEIDFIVTSKGIISTFNKEVYLLPWRFVSISKQEISIDSLSIYFNFSNDKQILKDNKCFEKARAYFQNKTFAYSFRYYNKTHRDILTKKQQRDVLRFSQAKNNFLSNNTGYEFTKLNRRNLEIRLFFINLLITIIAYLVGFCLIALV